MADVDKDFCFPCHNCQAGFTSLRDLRKHICNREDKLRNQKEPNKVQSQIKEDILKTKSYLKAGAKDKSTDIFLNRVDSIAMMTETNSCKIEDKNNMKPGGEDEPPQDSEIKKETKHECPICGIGVPNGVLDKHIAYHKKKGIIDCEINQCERTFSSKKLFKTHQVRDHGASKSKCHICKYEAKCSTTLEKHIRKHTGEKPFVCSECGDRYKTKQGLDDHIKRHKNIFDYPCDTCEEKFVSKGTLKQHTKVVHIKIEPVVCAECGRGFKFNQNYKEHIKLHTGEKDIKCRFCDKVFRLQGTRFKHERVHIGVKHHKCRICEKKFMQRDHLNVHTKMHLNQRDHICNQCGKGFIEPGGLRKHKCQHIKRERGQVYFEKGSKHQFLKKISSTKIWLTDTTKPGLENYPDSSLLFKERKAQDIQILDF